MESLIGNIINATVIITGAVLAYLSVKAQVDSKMAAQDIRIKAMEKGEEECQKRIAELTQQVRDLMKKAYGSP